MNQITSAITKVNRELKSMRFKQFRDSMFGMSVKNPRCFHFNNKLKNGRRSIKFVIPKSATRGQRTSIMKIGVKHFKSFKSWNIELRKSTGESYAFGTHFQLKVIIS